MGPLGPCRKTAAISGKQACCETKKKKGQSRNAQSSRGMSGCAMPTHMQ